MTRGRILHRLRRTLGLDRSILPARVNRIVDNFGLHSIRQEGLPSRLHDAWLSDVVFEHREARPIAARHFGLQKWKKSSAYRLELELDNGRRWSLVYKETRFNDEDYAAIKGLHQPIGKPEHTLYSSLGPDISRFTPQIYSIANNQTHDGYRCLMEDLNPRFHRVYSERDKRPLLSRMPEVHAALSKWAEVAQPRIDNLLNYDGPFVSEVILHAEKGLDGFAVRLDAETADRIAQIWPDIVQFLTADRNLERRSLRLIHGDFNTKNAMVAFKKDTGNVKLVDWEWCGMGTPHDDVASLLKRRNPALERAAMIMLTDQTEGLSINDHHDLLWWSRVFRIVLDASLLTHQYLGLAEPPPVVEARARGLWQGLARLHTSLKEEVTL